VESAIDTSQMLFSSKMLRHGGLERFLGFVQQLHRRGQASEAAHRLSSFSPRAGCLPHRINNGKRYLVAARSLRLYSVMPPQKPSSDSHPDFQQKQRRQQPSDADWASVMERIERDVMSDKVVLYMKGEPDAPLCGFSQKAVSILKAAGVTFQSYNVLADPLLREGIKKYSQWPTIPQLYVDGEFIGGSDIMESMYRSGELNQIMGLYGKKS
jgi:monothiol glutaredoxin